MNSQLILYIYCVWCSCNFLVLLNSIGFVKFIGAIINTHAHIRFEFQQHQAIFVVFSWDEFLIWHVVEYAWFALRNCQLSNVSTWIKEYDEKIMLIDDSAVQLMDDYGHKRHCTETHARKKSSLLNSVHISLFLASIVPFFS